MHTEVTILENCIWYYNFQKHTGYSKKGHLFIADVVLYIFMLKRSIISLVTWKGEKR